MPLYFVLHVFQEGIADYPWLLPTLKIAPWVGLIALLKWYFAGYVNKSERVMHGKVIMVTGGTSGIGAATVKDLAKRGAQIILLTHHAADDPFLIEYIDDLRATSDNEMIYAETVNLASLHSIRRFATKWIDNAPPRRLDLLLLFAATVRPRFGINEPTLDGLEPCWGINYLANFQLLSILSPALRVQPPDRDVRIIIPTCGSYVGGNLRNMKSSKDPLPEGLQYETSKLALTVFAQAFQKHLDAYVRPDKMPMNSRVVMVDPGLVRTPGMRRSLSMGSLWGLLFYMLLWPAYWLVLKSAEQGAQSFLMAAMEIDLGRGLGGRLIREGRDKEYFRHEVNDEKAQKELWEYSEQQITILEKAGAAQRTLEKKEQEDKEKREKVDGLDGLTGLKGKGNASANADANANGGGAAKERKPGSRRSKKA